MMQDLCDLRPTHEPDLAFLLGISIGSCKVCPVKWTHSVGPSDYVWLAAGLTPAARSNAHHTRSSSRKATALSSRADSSRSSIALQHNSLAEVPR